MGCVGFQKSYIIFRVGHWKRLRPITRWVGGVKKGQKHAYIIFEWSLIDGPILQSKSVVDGPIFHSKSVVDGPILHSKSVVDGSILHCKAKGCVFSKIWW